MLILKLWAGMETQTFYLLLVDPVRSSLPTVIFSCPCIPISSMFCVCTYRLSFPTYAAAHNHVNRLCLAAGVILIESGSAGYLGQVTIIRKVDAPKYVGGESGFACKRCGLIL